MYCTFYAINICYVMLCIVIQLLGTDLESSFHKRILKYVVSAKTNNTINGLELNLFCMILSSQVCLTFLEGGCSIIKICWQNIRCAVRQLEQIAQKDAVLCGGERQSVSTRCHTYM